MTFIGSILPQEKANDHMTTIEKMSWSSKNKPTKCYSLVVFFVFLIVIVIYKLEEEKKKKEKITFEKVKKLESLSDIGSSIGTCDILDRIYNINVYATPIIIPDELKLKVRSWLQEDEDLIRTATNQNVIHITNKVNYFIFRSKTNLNHPSTRYLVKQLTTIHSGQKDPVQRYR